MIVDRVTVGVLLWGASSATSWGYPATMSDLLLDAVQANPGDDEARLVYLDWLELEDPMRAACLRVDHQFALLPLGHPDYDSTWERLAWHLTRTDAAWAQHALHRYDVVVLNGGRRVEGLRELRTYLDCSLDDARSLYDEPGAVLFRGLFGAHAEALRRRFSTVAEGILGLILQTEPDAVRSTAAPAHYAVKLLAPDEDAADAVQRALDVSWNAASALVHTGWVASDLSVLDALLLEQQLEVLDTRARVVPRTPPTTEALS